MVYLVTQTHNIKEKYDINEIIINIYSNDSVIASYNSQSREFSSIFILGGNQIKQITLPLINPLNKISYKVICNSDVLYSSKTELYRDVIIFNEENIEIDNFKPYKGNVTICHFNDEVKFDQRLIIGEELIHYCNAVVYFGEKLTTGIDGDKYFFNRFVQAMHNRKELSIYEKINFILIEEQNNDEVIIALINGKNYKIDSIPYQNINFNEINYKRIEISELCIIGLNEFAFITVDHKKIIYRFIYTNNFLLNDERNKDIIKTTVYSDIDLVDKFNNYKECYLTNINKSSHVSLFNNDVEFKIYFELPMYKIHSYWEFFADRIPFIWMKNLNQTSVLTIRGVKIDYVMLNDERGNSLDEFNVYQKNGEVTIPLKTILNFNEESLILRLFNDGEIKEEIRVLSKNIYYKEEFNVSINENNIFEIYTPYEGYDDVVINVYEANTSLLVDSKTVDNESFITSFDLSMGKLYKYTIELRRRESNIFDLISGLIFEGTFKKFSVSYNSLIKKSLMIKEINPNESSIKIFNHWIDIIGYDSELHRYVGRVYKIINGSREDMKFTDENDRVNSKCLIEFLDNRSNNSNEIEIYINDLDRDALCYNSSNRTFTSDQNDEYIEILKVQLRRPK